MTVYTPGARPTSLNRYQFVVVCALRAKQLRAGCTPRLEGNHSAAVMAQMEVALGCVTGIVDSGLDVGQ